MAVKAYPQVDGKVLWRAGYWSADGLFYPSSVAGQWRDTREQAEADWRTVERIAAGVSA